MSRNFNNKKKFYLKLLHKNIASFFTSIVATGGFNVEPGGHSLSHHVLGSQKGPQS